MRMVLGSFALLLTALLGSVQSDNVDLQPAIAMVCGKNTQHKDIKSGEWITDSTGKKDCMKDFIEILQYCKQVYPELTITNYEEQPTSVRIRSWCAIGNPGPHCRGHGHSVKPVKCIAEDYTPSLIAKSGCSVLTISDGSACSTDSFWTSRASEKCGESNQVLDNKHRNVFPCGVNRWYGIQFACCASSRSARKVANLDPVCTQPKKSGVCRAAFDAWYFNVDSGKCVKFTYGGCGGNDNRFSSLKKCQDKCETNATIEDPLLNMELGPVILDDSASVQTTIASTQSTIDDHSSDSYFNAPLDPNNEEKGYSDALMDEMKDHESKMTSLMNQWNSAKQDLLRRGASSDEGDRVDSDLSKQLAALRNEHERKREQITSAHQARVDANLVGARTSAYNSLTNELNKPDIQPSKVVQAFHRYIQSEARDQRHTKKLLQHALDQNSDDVDVLNSRLDTIKTRVNNALTTAQHRLGTGDASDKLNDIVSDILPSSTTTDQVSTSAPKIFHDDVFGYNSQPEEEERPRIIDYGGLPPENFDNREEIDEDEMDDEEDIPPHKDHQTETNYEVDDTDSFYDDDLSPETPAPLNPMDFTMPDIDDGYDQPDDDIDPLANSQWEEETYDEQNWLIWVGVGGSCLLLIVLLVAGARAMGTRYNHRKQFARVEVEEQLTPEERQLLQMQQNGYENPTYKFFEKQQQQRA